MTEDIQKCVDLELAFVIRCSLKKIAIKFRLIAVFLVLRCLPVVGASVCCYLVGIRESFRFLFENIDCLVFLRARSLQQNRKEISHLR